MVTGTYLRKDFMFHILRKAARNHPCEKLLWFPMIAAGSRGLPMQNCSLQIPSAAHKQNI